MDPGEIRATLANLNSLQFKLEAAAGAAVTVEMRMRLIGQLCERIRIELKKLVSAHKANKKLKKDFSNEYWNDLSRYNIPQLSEPIKLLLDNKLIKE